jgi:hypothetical protein
MMEAVLIGLLPALTGLITFGLLAAALRDHVHRSTLRPVR